MTDIIYNAKAILVELQQEHADLIELFPRFNIYATLELGSIYIDGKKKDVETPIFMIQLFHHEVVSDKRYEEIIIESSFWSDVEKFENVFIAPHEQAYLWFSTFDDFDGNLIPKHLLMFSNDYSDSNHFQIDHIRYDTDENRRSNKLN